MNGNKRITGKEQFYTPKELAKSIVQEAKDLFGNLDNFLEPAGGSGAFVEAAKQIGFKNIVSYDIEPFHDLVFQGNFLDQDFEINNFVTISNPPFGRNNSLSIPFFNHAAKYSNLIGFIVPRSWRKWSVQNKLDPNFHLIKDQNIEINYVGLDLEPISNKGILKTCIQFWQKKKDIRQKIQVKDMSVIKKCKPNEANVSLTVFGHNYGKLEIGQNFKPNTTKMFFKTLHPKAIEALLIVDYSRFAENTAYIPALSIHEINYLLNEVLFLDPMLVRP